jgi:Flp pilus assembly protein TadD
VLRHAAQRALAQGLALKAVALQEKIAAKNPNNPVVQNDLAWAQIQAKDPKALVSAQKAAKLMPDNPQILDTLGMAQALAGQRAQALVSLRTAVNLAPAAALPRLHLAEQLLADGDRKAATAMVQAIDSKLLAKADQTTLAQLGKSLQP